MKAIAVQADVGDYARVKQAIEAATQKLGPITLLVNNAGNAGPDMTMRTSPLFWETDPAEWDRYFHTNLDGVMNCCHAIVPGMVKQGRGRIVTIVSDAGRVGGARLAAYSAAKAGAAGFVWAPAREAGRYGRPEDVAPMVLFLCSDAAAWITGQTYPVNGGYSLAP